MGTAAAAAAAVAGGGSSVSPGLFMGCSRVDYDGVVYRGHEGTARVAPSDGTVSLVLETPLPEEDAGGGGLRRHVLWTAGLASVTRLHTDPALGVCVVEAEDPCGAPLSATLYFATPARAKQFFRLLRSVVKDAVAVPDDEDGGGGSGVPSSFDHSPPRSGVRDSDAAPAAETAEQAEFPSPAQLRAEEQPSLLPPSCNGGGGDAAEQQPSLLPPSCNGGGVALGRATPSPPVLPLAAAKPPPPLLSDVDTEIPPPTAADRGGVASFNSAFVSHASHPAPPPPPCHNSPPPPTHPPTSLAVVSPFAPGDYFSGSPSPPKLLRSAAAAAVAPEAATDRGVLPEESETKDLPAMLGTNPPTAAAAAAGAAAAAAAAELAFRSSPPPPPPVLPLFFEEDKDASARWQQPLQQQQQPHHYQTQQQPQPQQQQQPLRRRCSPPRDSAPLAVSLNLGDVLSTSAAPAAPDRGSVAISAAAASRRNELPWATAASAALHPATPTNNPDDQEHSSRGYSTSPDIVGVVEDRQAASAAAVSRVAAAPAAVAASPAPYLFTRAPRAAAASSGSGSGRRTVVSPHRPAARSDTAEGSLSAARSLRGVCPPRRSPTNTPFCGVATHGSTQRRPY